MSTKSPKSPDKAKKPKGNEPIALSEALASFDALWSPRIVTHVNDYDVRIAKVEGEHLWHAHDDTDEFFLVLDGELYISLREAAGERTVRLPQGSVFTVPRGTEHRYVPPGSCPPAPRRRAATSVDHVIPRSRGGQHTW
ncbi:cupin domain-containing protein, partial [Streptomyces chattanoogensis]